MIRIAGCCFVIAATSLWGAEQAKRLREEVSEIKYVQKMIVYRC